MNKTATVNNADKCWQQLTTNPTSKAWLWPLLQLHQLHMLEAKRRVCKWRAPKHLATTRAQVKQKKQTGLWHCFAHVNGLKTSDPSCHQGPDSLGKGGCSDKVNLDGSSHWSNELNWSLEQHSNIKSGGFGFLKWRYPRIIYLYQIFHDKPTSLIGIIDGKLQTMIKPSR